jgi:hypothetical protein
LSGEIQLLNFNKTMMKKIVFCLLAAALLPVYLFSQLFRNATNQLPDNGAKGATMDVRAADLDKDGDLDLVLANEFQANAILFNDGRGNFTNGSANNLPQVIHDSEDVAIADFNGDGHLDLVFCSEDDFVHEYYWGNGRGGFTTATVALPNSEANAVITTDLNGDGKPDLLFGNNGTTTVLINDGQGGFTNESNRVPAVPRVTQDLAMADVDQDGDLDLFLGNENGNLLFLNTGKGFFVDSSANHLPALTGLETRKVTFGDVDKDGDQDVFLANVAFRALRNPRDRLLLNDGRGRFTDASATQLPSDNDHTLDGIFEDFDNDGDLDLVTAAAFGGSLKTYRNDGRGFFTENTQEVLGDVYQISGLGVISADFNGDGRRDLYFCDRRLPNTNTKDLLFLRQAPTKTADLKADELLIYPNPVEDSVFIETKAAIKTVHLLHATGQVVQKLTLHPQGDSRYRCDLSRKTGMAAGLYVLKVETKKGVLSRTVFLR